MSSINFQTGIEKIQQSLGLPIVFLSECDSTNRVAAEMARTGWRGVVTTDFQTAGRGRLEREWHSERGKNVLLSLVLDVKCPIQNIPRVPLLMAASIAEEFDVFVKWPNDIWDAQGRKLGGILSSVQHRGDTNTIIVGVGLNVHQTVFPDTLSAVSLQQLYQQPIQRADVLMKVIKAMLSTSVHENFDRWRERSFTLGKWVSVAGRKGLATGIREDGALIVDGISVTTGDVHLVENDDVTCN